MYGRQRRQHLWPDDQCPGGAQPQSGSDGHLTVIETATGAEYDFWDAAIEGSTLEAGTGSVVNVNTGNGLGAQGDAANFALSAGLLRPSELASGVINHALVVTVPCTSANGATVGYSYPATGGWGEACGDYWNESGNGAPLLGQLLRLNLTDAQITSSRGATMAEDDHDCAGALRRLHRGHRRLDQQRDRRHHPGLRVLDRSRSARPVGGDRATVRGLRGVLSSSVPIPVSALQVVNVCVALGTCPTSVSVPIAPAVPTAPPVAPPTAPVAPPTSAAGGAGGSVQSTPVAATPTRHERKHTHKRHRAHTKRQQPKQHHRHARRRATHETN